MAWPLSHLTLKVLDLDAQVAFYERFGLRVLERKPSEALLGAGDTALLRLVKLAGGSPRPPRTAGLYHFALLLPSEEDLGSFLVHAGRARLPFVGAGDHLVSQALYFQDPEDNGIEVYADRPRESWDWKGGRLAMGSDPVDMERLAGLARTEWRGFPAGTLLGHMHLSVADLDRSQAYYEGLGMELIAALPMARFLAWDRYHHHLGMNVWRGVGVDPVRPEVSGLESFTIIRPGATPAEPDPDGIVVAAARPAEVARG